MTAKVITLEPIDGEWVAQWRMRQTHLRDRMRTGIESMELFCERARDREDNSSHKIALADRPKLASALNTEIERLETDCVASGRPFRRRDLMVAARLATADDPHPTKRLHELTLKEDESGEDLCAAIFNYQSLIESLVSFSTEVPEKIYARIFAGTSFSGVETDIVRHRKLVASLKQKIGRIDKLMHVAFKSELREVFDEIAQASAFLRAEGTPIAWPSFDIDAGSGAVPRKSSADVFRSGWTPGHHADVRNAMHYTHLDWHDAVLHLPRCYLGCAAILEEWMRDGDDVEAVNDVLRGIDVARRSITEARSLSDDRTRMTFDDGGVLVDRRYRPSGFDEDGHCWLVIYPSRSRTGLIPML